MVGTGCLALPSVLLKGGWVGNLFMVKFNSMDIFFERSTTGFSVSSMGVKYFRLVF